MYRVIGYTNAKWGGADLTISSTTVYASLPVLGEPDATDVTGVTYPTAVMPIMMNAMIGTASATHGITLRLAFGATPTVLPNFNPALLETAAAQRAIVYQPLADPNQIPTSTTLVIPAGSLIVCQAVYVVATSDTDIYVDILFAMLQLI